MKKPRKPLKQCYNCLDYDPGLLGSIFDYFARYGYCLRFGVKVRAEHNCEAFKLAPHFGDRAAPTLCPECEHVEKGAPDSNGVLICSSCGAMLKLGKMRPALEFRRMKPGEGPVTRMRRRRGNGGSSA